MDVVDVNELQREIAYQEEELQELMQQVTQKESEISNLQLKEKMALDELGMLHERENKTKTKLDDCKKRIMDYDSDKIRGSI